MLFGRLGSTAFRELLFVSIPSAIAWILGLYNACVIGASFPKMKNLRRRIVVLHSGPDPRRSVIRGYPVLSWSSLMVSSDSARSLLSSLLLAVAATLWFSIALGLPIWFSWDVVGSDFRPFTFSERHFQRILLRLSILTCPLSRLNIR